MAHFWHKVFRIFLQLTTMSIRPFACSDMFYKIHYIALQFYMCMLRVSSFVLYNINTIAGLF